MLMFMACSYSDHDYYDDDVVVDVDDDVVDDNDSINQWNE